MKRFFYLTLSIALFSCSEGISTKSQAKKYYIVIEREKQSVSGEWKNETVVDSVQTVTDSAAYLEGVIAYKVQLETPRLHKKKGIKSWFKAKSFKVLNADGKDISSNISPNTVRKGKWIIEKGEL